MNPAFLALATFASVPAETRPPAPDWQLLSRNHLISMAWDRASLVRRGDVVEIVVRATADIAPRPSHGDFLTEIRCSDRRARIVRTTNYAPDGAALVEESPRAKFFRIKPNTYHETMRAAVCPP
jgi:hypothetical protein